jgi:hypothetical protein
MAGLVIAIISSHNFFTVLIQMKTIVYILFGASWKMYEITKTPNQDVSQIPRGHPEMGVSGPRKPAMDCLPFLTNKMWN